MNTPRSKTSALHLDWLQIEVSAKCNASCAYCVLSCYRDQWQGGLMDMQTFNRLQPNFSSADLVYLQGWGEPLLHPQLAEMIKAVKDGGTKVGFTTNATLLKKDRIEQLLPLNIDVLGVSIAGTRAETHNRFRHGCDFDLVDEHMLELKSMKEAHSSATPDVHIAFMIFRSNWQDLQELPALAARWGAKQVVVSNLTFVGREDLQEENLLNRPELWGEVRAALESAKSAAAGQGVELQFYGPEVGERLATCRENVLHSCFVTYRGDVTPCVMTGFSMSPDKPARHYYQGKEYDIENLAFGNINNQSLAEIWESRSAHEFHGVYQERVMMLIPDLERPEVPSPCRHCYKMIEQ